MTIDVLTWNIDTTYTGSWDVDGGGTTSITAGSTIVVKLDDVTNTLTAWKNGSTKLLNGPNLFFGYDGAATLATIAPFHQYCEGTTLHQVGTSNGFPYGTLSNNENNSECQIAPTCDLEISSTYTITPATGPATADGAIVGSATSSNGTIKYSFTQNFNYGENFPGNPLDVLADWVSFNTSSEPMAWATGAVPTMTVTAPTTLGSSAKSDWFGPPYVSDPLTEGVTYKWNFQFTAYSDTTKYLFIKIVIGDVFFNVLNSKTLAGYAEPGGTVITGSWEVIAPADVGGQPLRLAVFVEYPAGTSYDGSVLIDSFVDASATSDDPGVQTDLNFSGLLPGTYTIYAKDAIGCQDSITFEIPVTTAYNVRYRLEYTDTFSESGKWNRLDIEQRAYEGEVEEICGGESPVIIRYEGDRDDPNVSLVASNARLQLLVETPGQFNDMFLSDDRKYRVKHYIGDDLADVVSNPTDTIYWTGYIVPEFHSEPYLFAPYYTEITASDGLGELKNKPFKDINGNIYKGEMSMIKIASEMFKKTGLELNIRSGINVFDSGIDTAASDDPLAQAYVDTRIYYSIKKVPEKCDVVIKSLVESFRGQIFQSKGVWWLIRLSDAVGTFAYREFTFEGVYSSNSTFNTVFELDFPSAIHAAKAMFTGRSQLLSFVRNYGYFSITHDLKKDGNLIDEGRFESEDIIELGSGNKTFKNWNVLIGQSGVKYGHETVVNGDSTGAFYFDFTSAVGSQVDTQLYSAAMPLDSTNGRIRLKFQYFVTPTYNVPYIRIAWTLKFNMSDGTIQWLTYATNGAITYALEESKNEIYVTQYDTWNTFDLLTEIPIQGVANSFEISFFFHDHHGRDFASIADLKAFVPSTLSNPGGTKRMVASAAGETSIYVAEYSLDAESSPSVIRPDTYDSGSGDFRWLWRLEKIIPVSSNSNLVSRIKFDNVSLAFYPRIIVPTTQYIDPQETLVYSEEVDPLVVSDFSTDVLLGDMIRYDNTLTMNEKNLYQSYLRLSDGTPTLNWNRSGVTESKRLLQITLEDYIAQFSLPQRRLSGAKICTDTLHFINCIRDNVDGTRYRPMTFEFDTKRAAYTPDVSGVVAGADGEPPYAPGEFSAEEFNNEFNIGS